MLPDEPSPQISPQTEQAPATPRKARQGSGAVQSNSLRPEEYRPRRTVNLDVKDYEDKESQLTFYAYLGQLNPFQYLSAEQEAAALNGKNGLFWNEHSCYKRLFNSGSPMVLYGEKGSGKSAFARYYCAALEEGPGIKDATLAVFLSSPFTLASACEPIALDVLGFTKGQLPRVCYMKPDRKGQLTDFLVAQLGWQRVLDEVKDVKRSRGKSQFVALVNLQAAAVHHPSPAEWLTQLNTVAGSFWMHGSHLVIDNVEEMPAPEYVAALKQLRKAGTQVTLLTPDLHLAEQLRRHGFSKDELTWNPDHLLDLVTYRIDCMNRHAHDAGYSHSLQREHNFEKWNLHRYFEDAAWQYLLALKAELRTPCRTFFVFSELMHQQFLPGQERFGEDNVRAAFDALVKKYGP